MKIRHMHTHIHMHTYTDHHTHTAYIMMHNTHHIGVNGTNLTTKNVIITITA